jgi:hypothetical protein
MPDSPEPFDLTDRDLTYLCQLVGTNLNLKRAALAQMAPRPDQDPAAFAALKQRYQHRLTYHEGLYHRLQARLGKPRPGRFPEPPGPAVGHRDRVYQAALQWQAQLKDLRHKIADYYRVDWKEMNRLAKQLARPDPKRTDVVVTDQDITIQDEQGEIVYWHLGEFHEDPALALTVAGFIRAFFQEGAPALRELVDPAPDAEEGS